MKHLKRIYEMDQWATSNRLGDVGGSHYTEITPENVKHSLESRLPIRVRIKKGTQYYGGRDDGSNPTNVIGSIIDYNGMIRVMWDNGHTNSYYKEDLEIVIE